MQSTEKLRWLPLAEHAEHHDQALGADQAPQGGPGLAHGRRIVAAVQYHSRTLSDHLQASRPQRRGQTFPNGAVVDLAEPVRRRDGQGGVLRLIVAYQRQPEVFVLEARPGDAENVTLPALGGRFDTQLPAQAPQRRVHVPRAGLDDLQGLAIAAGDDAVAGLDDGGLLARDLPDRVAKVLLVVQVDVGDRGHAEVEGVGRVEAPAETDLAHQHIDPRCQEGDRQHGEHLELGRRPNVTGDAVEHRQQRLERVHEILLADRPSVELDPLGVGDEMRLGHETNSVPGRAQHRRQARAG